MDDGLYLSDLLYWANLCKKRIEEPKANWASITELSSTMLNKTREFYKPPKCPMEYDKTIIDRGELIIGKLETLNDKIKTKEKQASMEALAEVEKQLKIVLH